MTEEQMTEDISPEQAKIYLDQARAYLAKESAGVDPRVHVTKDQLEGVEVPEEPVDLGHPVYVVDEEIEFISQYFKSVRSVSELPLIAERFTSNNRAARRAKK